MGIWPNRLRLFDEERREFTGEIPLRHGAVTSYGPTARSHGGRRLYYITDRMEAVEVVDVARRAVVDVVRLSTPERRLRIYTVAADATGKRLYLRVSGVGLGVDRFEPLDFEIVTYDLERHEIVDTFRLPPTVHLGFFDSLLVSEDGRELITVSDDVVHLDVETREERRRLALSKPRAPGYGPLRISALLETEPDVVQGIYETTEPAQQKKMSGFFRIDLKTDAVTSFELGPEMDLGTLALSPDGRYAYAGLGDLAKIDLGAKRVVARKKGFERGRTNTTILVSSDGGTLFVSGVGDRIYLVDAETLERRGTIPVGGDLMSPVTAVPHTSP